MPLKLSGEVLHSISNMRTVLLSIAETQNNRLGLDLSLEQKQKNYETLKNAFIILGEPIHFRDITATQL